MKRILITLALIIFLSLNSISVFAYYYEYVNQTDGFSVYIFGGQAVYGIWGNDTDFWIVDSPDDFVYHTLKDGTNLTDGFSTRSLGSRNPSGIWGNDTDFWFIDATDDFVYHTLKDGTNITDGFSTGAFGSTYPYGIWGNNTDFWITDIDTDFVYHTLKDGTNITDGFSTAAFGSGNPLGIWGNDTDFWIIDTVDDFAYHTLKDGTNITDGFSTAVFGAEAPNGIWSNDMMIRDFWITDGGDEFVYHLRRYNLSIYYNSTTYETAREGFGVNINYNNDVYTGIMAKLNYNGTDYISTKTTDSGGYAFFNNNINIPLGAGIKNFYWNFTLINSTDIVYIITDTYTQTINIINMSVCGSDKTNMSFNFTAYKEEDRSRINYFDFKVTFEYWLGNEDIKKNFSVDSSAISEQTICINPGDLTYYINAIIEYSTNSTTEYVTRNYYFENDIANNITQNISLYLLNQSYSTSFIIHVQDQNQQDVEGALVYTQRYYPGTGEYKTVQIAKTDSNGKTVGFFNTEDVDYRFIIKLNGITELITSKQKVFPGETPYTLLFTIGEALEKPWADFDDLEDLIYTLSFNSTTNITTFSYEDTSGTFIQARLLVVELKHNETDLIICNTTSTESFAIITCDTSDYSGTFKATAFITRTTEKTVSIIQFAITTAVEVFGMLGLFLGWWILLVGGCAFFWHPIAGIIGTESAIIAVQLIGLISFSPLFIFGSLAISIILIFVLKD